MHSHSGNDIHLEAIFFIGRWKWWWCLKHFKFHENWISLNSGDFVWIFESSKVVEQLAKLWLTLLNLGGLFYMLRHSSKRRKQLEADVGNCFECFKNCEIFFKFLPRNPLKNLEVFYKFESLQKYFSFFLKFSKSHW